MGAAIGQIGHGATMGAAIGQIGHGATIGCEAVSGYPRAGVVAIGQMGAPDLYGRPSPFTG